MYITDAEVLTFSSAYSKLVILGLGPGHTYDSKRLGDLILSERVGYNGPRKFPALKKRLSQALDRVAGQQDRGSDLIDWQQAIDNAGSCAEIGRFCVQLVSVLFPEDSEEL